MFPHLAHPAGDKPATPPARPQYCVPTQFDLAARPSIEQQVARTSRDRNRPLLRNANPEKILRDLLALRDPLYREIADLVVETDERPPRMVVLDILERLAQLSPR